jgi:hypothetical protein
MLTSYSMAREADDMVGLRTHRGGDGHFRQSGIARIVHCRDAAELLERRQAGGAVRQRPSENGTDKPGRAA